MPSVRLWRCYFRLLPVLLPLAALWLVAGCVAGPSATPSPPAASSGRAPTLDDLWDGDAHFVVDVEQTGLPMGESDTLILPDGQWRTYLHASDQSAGIVDQCGDPVPFPGCVVLLGSADGRTFTPSGLAGNRCLFPCRQCPCTSGVDHIDQQQYPRVVRYVAEDGHARWWMVYEYRATVMLRRSDNGVTWSLPEEVPLTGVWETWLKPCRPEERIGDHPFAPSQYDCLTGAPPGLALVETPAGLLELYVFVGLGQNPGSMGCLRGPADGPAAALRKCDHNPLFTGAPTYGPTDVTGPAANPYFDFRTISSADLLRVGARSYMFYEGVRGAGPGDGGDTQFALGLARTTTQALDGPWELFPGNPILVDLPGNVGLGHADVVEVDGETVLFTSLDGVLRSRLVLRWRSRE